MSNREDKKLEDVEELHEDKYVQATRSLDIDINIEYEAEDTPVATLWCANIHNDEDGYYHECALPKIQILDQ